ncbi:hypothetical protein PR003_g24692 [Phytophthora rubi]|uniref:RxLR effector protein n=1 Tax=Phytophthora rubi TaxID=129364 RepID=A0A6A4CKN3_9STRA|nr:hypothetical protein PR003_g24692 [Phytophthora rubi]
MSMASSGASSSVALASLPTLAVLVVAVLAGQEEDTVERPLIPAIRFDDPRLIGLPML